MINEIVREDLGAGAEKLIKNVDFSNQHLCDIDGKETVYQGCKFNYSIITRGYFHKAAFKNCKFIGTRIEDSVFRSATFESCDFSYADFDRTVVPVPQLLANLPAYANVRWEFLHTIKANASSLGDTRYDSILVFHEARTEIEHWRGIANGGTSYYQKYKRTERLYARLKQIRLLTERYVWGHGESLSRLLISTFLLLCLLSLFNASGLITDLETITIASTVRQVFSSFTFLGALYVDLPSVSSADVLKSPITSVLAVALRYASIGLAIPVLYKHISRR
ncbi:pentapeptide repeat-containing protein [Pseudomonas putida]